MHALTRTHFADSVDTDLGRWLIDQSRENARDDAIDKACEWIVNNPAWIPDLVREHAKPGSNIQATYDELIDLLAAAMVDARGDE